MARSGTTLIEQIVASHPAVHGAGELRLFDRAAATIRDLMPGAPDYPQMVLSMEGVACSRSRNALCSRTRIVGARLPCTSPTRCRRISLFAGLIHLALPDAILIHAVRDPLDTCVSCFSKHFIDGQLHTYDLAELGRYYLHYRALMAHWHRVLPPGRILDVSYEDTVADLEGSARRIIAHCRLPWDSVASTFISPTDGAHRKRDAGAQTDLQKRGRALAPLRTFPRPSAQGVASRLRISATDLTVDPLGPRRGPAPDWTSTLS